MSSTTTPLTEQLREPWDVVDVDDLQLATLQPLQQSGLADLYDKKNFGMDGLDLLRMIPSGSIPLVFFDPQYDHLLVKMKYGNKLRQLGRHALKSQDVMDIKKFGQEIVRILKPAGHVALWMDQFILLSTNAGEGTFMDDAGKTVMEKVGVCCWDKGRMGMGWRFRHQCEYLTMYQKTPRPKGMGTKVTWTRRDIPDVWREPDKGKRHPHAKPIDLQAAIIDATTKPGEVVVEPTAGGFSTLTAAHSIGRRFLGCEFLAEDDPALNPKGRANA